MEKGRRCEVRDFFTVCNNRLNTAEEVRRYEEKYRSPIYIRRECPVCGQVKPIRMGNAACEECMEQARNGP